MPMAGVKVYVWGRRTVGQVYQMRRKAPTDGVGIKVRPYQHVALAVTGLPTGATARGLVQPDCG